MGHTCCVHGCTNRAGGPAKVSFYRIPTIRLTEGEQTKDLSRQRHNTWLARINRKNFVPTAHTRICSVHFVTGKPAELYDTAHPDWAPSLKLAAEAPVETPPNKLVPSGSSSIQRYQRSAERQQKRKRHTAAELQHTVTESEDDMPVPPVDCSQTKKQRCSFVLRGKLEHMGQSSEQVGSEVCDSVICSKIRSECQRLTVENLCLKDTLEATRITEESFRDNEKRVRYYTGLPSFETLMAVFTLVSPYIPDSHRVALSKFQKLILVFMKLRLNLPLQDLAFRFNVSQSTVSRTFLAVIHVMYVRLKRLIYWPEREDIQASMPMEFRKHFGVKVVVIIDCFEIFIERPSNLLARAQTWSSYKHHNTVKFLIGITPQGSISFISKGWGGRSSDKYITENSGLLQKLTPGDIVLADRGFDIRESVGLMCAEVKIPSFTKGKTQLPALEVESTRNIAHVRIHVERVIGLARNKYTILSGILPLDYFSGNENETPVVDKIVTVCCCLTNMCESVIPFS